MNLRPPKDEDFSCLLAINDTAHPNPWSGENLRSELTLTTGSEAATRGFWGQVVEVGENVAGYLFSRRQGQDFELMIVCVAKDHQRQGLGWLLLGALKAEVLRYLDCQVLGNAEIFLEVSARNRAAIELYLAFGFAEYTRRQKYYEDGSDGVCMKLKVAKP